MHLVIDKVDHWWGLGILHGGLRHSTVSDEATAWPLPKEDQKTGS